MSQTSEGQDSMAERIPKPEIRISGSGRVFPHAFYERCPVSGIRGRERRAPSRPIPKQNSAGESGRRLALRGRADFGFRVSGCSRISDL